MLLHLTLILITLEPSESSWGSEAFNLDDIKMPTEKPKPHLNSLSKSSETTPPPWTKNHLVVDSALGNWTMFDAFDCTKPKMVHPVYIEALEKCPINNEALDTWNKQFLIVQKRKRSRISVWKCKLTRTELGAYCGASDHQTLSLDQMSFDTVIPLTEEECKTIINKNQYCVPGYQCTPITMSRKTRGKVQVKYHRAGKSYYTASDLACYGGAVLGSEGKIRNNFVLYTHDTVEIKHEIYLRYEDGRLENPITKHVLNSNCRIKTGTCTENGWRMTWTYTELQEECNSVSTRETSGVVHYPRDTQEERRVFIATDGSLNSFVLGPLVDLCGYSVYSTDFDNIFLASVGLKHKFANISAVDIDLSLDLAIKLAYSHNKLLNYTQQIYRTVLLEQCLRQERRIENYATLAATQLAFNEGQTVSLTPGAFATGVGEIVYRYYCDHHRVQAMVGHSKCYNALPVIVPETVIGNFAALLNREKETNPNGTDERPMFYIEPHSHRILISAVEKPCTRMPAHYKNVNGQFVSVNPYLVLPSHQPIGIRPRTSLIPGVGDTNWNGGGVYSDAQLQSFVEATYDNTFRMNVQTRLADEIRGKNPASETLPLTAVSRIFGIGSAVANILSVLFGWAPYIMFLVACLFSYSWAQNICSCGYRLKLLKGNVTRFSNWRVITALCCPHQMTQHSTPGRHRPPPIFSYRQFKQNLFGLPNDPDPHRQSLWQRAKLQTFQRFGLQPIPTVTAAPTPPAHAPVPSANTTTTTTTPSQQLYPPIPPIPNPPPNLPQSFRPKQPRLEPPNSFPEQHQPD